MVFLHGVGDIHPHTMNFRLGKPVSERSKKREVRPLIGIPSPRDIPDFLLLMRYFCEAPRIWAKYHKEVLAYRRIRDFFLKEKEFTHLVILPDDLLVTPVAFNLLKKDLEEEDRDYPILSGVCNALYGDDRVTCRDSLGGAFITNEELDTMRMKQGGGPIVQVRHEGFAMPFIRRDVVEQIEFGTIYLTAVDYHFSLHCHRLKIPLHVDTRARMIHLASQPPRGNYQYFKVGKEKPYLLYEE